MKRAAEHDDREGVRGGGDQLSDSERQKADPKRRGCPGFVGYPPDEREHCGVAEKESADDRRSALEVIDTYSDAAHDVRKCDYDDVGVRRCEKYAERCQKKACLVRWRNRKVRGQTCRQDAGGNAIVTCSP